MHHIETLPVCDAKLCIRRREKWHRNDLIERKIRRRRIWRMPRNRVESRIARRYIVCVLGCKPLIRIFSRKRRRSFGTYWSVIRPSCHQIEKVSIFRQARLSTKSVAQINTHQPPQVPIPRAVSSWSRQPDLRVPGGEGLLPVKMRRS